MTRVLAALLLACACACACACGEDEPPPPPPLPPPPPPPEPIASPRSVATAASFDLVVTADGAALVWGPPSNGGGGVRMVALNPTGGVRGEERVLYRAEPGTASPLPPDAVDLAAAAGGGRLGAVWVARVGRASHVMATHGDDAGEAFAPVEELGEVTAPARPGERGGVAAAAAGDGIVGTLFRLGPARCPDRGDSDCVRFERARLGAGEGERGGMALIVPRACPRALAGQLWFPGLWYYGVCAADGDDSAMPRTTVYAIQFEPEYAHAEPVLAGCEPLGIAPMGEGAALVARCPSGRLDAVAFFDAGREKHVLADITRNARCADGRPELILAPSSGLARSHALSAATSRLAPLLDEELAPAGSRAVWTGEALLVAAPLGREVALRRYQCREEALVRTDRS